MLAGQLSRLPVRTLQVVCADILSDDGTLALEITAVKVNLDSLSAAERMRRCSPPELAAAALTQVALRRRVREKLPMADRMFFIPGGLEQAIRWVVARWHVAWFIEAGVNDVWDLGYGIGVDAVAFTGAGLGVHAVESDPVTAVLTRASLALSRGGEVTMGCAEDARVPEGCRTFLDPARHTAWGRIWDVADLASPWSLVEDHLQGQRVVLVKLGPGLPKQLTPGDVRAAQVSARGDMVELMLSNASSPGLRAVVFPRPEPEPHALIEGVVPPPVAPPGRFIHEPDNAAVHAGPVAKPAPDGWLLAPGMAYVSSDSPIGGPLVTSYRMIDMLDHDVTTLRRWVKQYRIERLEVKRCAIDINPAVLWRQLKPKDDGLATLLLAWTVTGVRAFVVGRVG